MNKLEQMQWQYKQKLADFAKDDNFNGFCLDETQLNSLITEVWNEAIANYQTEYEQKHLVEAAKIAREQAIKECEGSDGLEAYEDGEHSMLQEIMDEVVLLHKRKELDDNGFCTIRDLLHSKALLPRANITSDKTTGL